MRAVELADERFDDRTLLAVADDAEPNAVRLEQLRRVDDRRQSLQWDERAVKDDEVRLRLHVGLRLEDVLLRAEPQDAEPFPVEPVAAEK